MAEVCKYCDRVNGTEEQLEDVDFENTVPDLCFSDVLYDGDTDPHCSRIALHKELRAKANSVILTKEEWKVVALLLNMAAENAREDLCGLILRETGYSILTDEGVVALARKIESAS